MEGNLSTRNMIPGSSYGVLDLEGSMHPHHQQNPQILQQRHSHQSMVHVPIRDVFPFSIGNIHECDQPLSIVDHNKGDMNSTSDEDERSFNEDSVAGHNEVGKAKKASPWHRMKWSDGMIRLLITIVSYLGEDYSSECGSSVKRKSAILQKKGKWKVVSKVMAERGCYVSPQQCEDKFNDLNKRYKRLTDVLGKGTSCKVVENPGLLDMMSHLSDKVKENVRKILSSKHLFYEEMCSYHHGNRLHLPADPALQRSLQLALKCRDENEAKRLTQDDVDDDELTAETEYRDEDVEENNTNCGMIGNFGNPHPSVDQDTNKRSHAQSIQTDMNHGFPEGTKVSLLRSRSLQLEEQKLRIDVQVLELEKQRFKWQRFNRKKDRELDKLKMENERIKLENEQMALELKRREYDAADYI
ncbi:uncharacterized protein LOC143881910 [Tasmannia lanceolata]|uniref:uncharacterized protein LOC143881910 n=1 Tax=Tasmannia lanceolata TaxID=3420 RepID=UPI004063B323